MIFRNRDQSANDPSPQSRQVRDLSSQLQLVFPARNAPGRTDLRRHHGHRRAIVLPRDRRAVLAWPLHRSNPSELLAEPARRPHFAHLCPIGADRNERAVRLF
jgi:hypothetical protein